MEACEDSVQSSKGSLTQESEEEDQRVPSSRGYMSSKDCWGDKEQKKVFGRGADQSSSLEDSSACSSGLQDSSCHGRSPRLRQAFGDPAFMLFLLLKYRQPMIL